MNTKGPGEAFLSLTRNRSRTRDRIAEEIHGGARSLHGIAHRSWLNVEQATTELVQMMIDGWFKLVPVNGRDVVMLAEPGEQLIDADLYCGIISAVHAGAGTVEAIAEQLEVPCDDTLVLAVAVSLRIAKGHTGG